FADNASTGIEPAFSWVYTRKKRMADESRKKYSVEDHAYRMFKHLHGIDDDVTVLPFDPGRELPPGKLWTESDGKRHAMLPSYFVTALEMGALDHMRMSAAVQPFIDTAISKTVNVPVDYPFEEFEDLYLEAWRSGLKGLTTYRPNAVVGSVLEVQQQAVAPQDFDVTDPDRRIRLEKAPQPPLASLRWPGRPELPNGNPCWTYAVRHPLGDFAVFIGHIENGPAYPFEVWVNGAEQPRGLGAIAKTLSMDMRTEDRQWLDMKLSALQKASGDDAFDMAMPPSGENPRVLDGLCKALSLDMRVWDPAWIGMKLRKLLNYAETNGSFLARIPGSDKAQNWPSTIAYLSQLMIHRYAMLGILTEEGY